MKNQVRTYKKIVKSYLKEVKSALFCSPSMKQAFLSTVRQRIEELFPDFSTLSVEELYKEIGTPEEIACSLENHSDIEQLKKKAKRYKVAKIAYMVLLLVAVLIIAFFVFLFISGKDYLVIFDM